MFDRRGRTKLATGGGIEHRRVKSASKRIFLPLMVYVMVLMALILLARQYDIMFVSILSF